MVIAALILITVGSVIACHLIARSRGGDGVFWGVMGFLFGPLAIPFAFRAKRKPEPGAEAES